MSVPLRFQALLDLASADLDAAEVLARVGNRYAAYHVQQAVEKMLKAALLRAGREAGAEHRLDVLLGTLDSGDADRVTLAPFARYTPYATTYRYPSPRGRVAAPPPSAQVVDDVRGAA